MIKLIPNVTTGKQICAIVDKAIKAREKEINQRVHLTDFCKVSTISRQQLHGYSTGDNPGLEGLAKIATGLRAWGNEVDINI